MDSTNLPGLIQLALTNWPAFLIICVVLVASGGGTVALIQSIAASRRGIKGDALVKEKNSIDGFIGLSTIQETTITRQENTIAAQGKEIDTLKGRLDDMDIKLDIAITRLNDVTVSYRHEIDYSNALVAQAKAAGLPIIPRPYVITTVTTDVHTETASVEPPVSATIGK